MKNRQRDAGDVIDRYSISFLKMERINEQASKNEHEWLSLGLEELKTEHSLFDWDQFADYIYNINTLIWDLESELRQGQIDNDLLEVGKRAIAIRKLNSLRVGFKNIVNKLCGEGVQDIKQNHVSQ